MPDSLGPYRIVRKLGEGGMGVVYAAEDTRLGRAVALKTVRAELTGTEARERLRREARAAASINHPHICQLYEIGEDGGELFIAMELLEGESLAARIDRGRMMIAEAAPIALQVLGALSALHRRGILHRDLKPSNIFITEHGAKLLDFGVARAIEDGQHTQLALTGPGTLLGTPRYFAPETASGAPVDARADLFAMGAILYEMLSARPAFDGDSAVRVLHAVMYEQPPSLSGTVAITAVDRVIQRALAKDASARYGSADEFARDLRMASAEPGVATVAVTSRLIVLPFRLLRPDPEVDFLGFSLADAVTSSLSGLGSLVVRSSLKAAAMGGDSDLKRLARDADVDVVLSGTLLRAGTQVRLTAELAEAPSGAILWSQVLQVSFEDIFQLHDTLVQKLIDALAIPLTAREHRILGRDVPATAKAYEFYLRANEVANDPTGWDHAIDLYRKCVDHDPRYAPGWARLGYVHRLMAKFRVDDTVSNRAHAMHALDRALAINPDQPFAHKVRAQLDVENGRAPDAMTRLLRQAMQTTGDPELYAGLCHAFRYCGLLDASVRAHERAVQIDSAAPTSVLHTWYMQRQFQRVVEGHMPSAPNVAALALVDLGRSEEALALLDAVDPKLPPRFRDFNVIVRRIIDHRPITDMQTIRSIVETFSDPEGTFYAAQGLARLGEIELAIRGLTRAIEGGYYCYPAFAVDPWLDPLRSHPHFDAAMQYAKQQHEIAVVAFEDAGGRAIVDVGT